MLLLDDPEFQKLPTHPRLVYIALTVTLGPSGIEDRYREALVHELAARAGGTARKVAAALDELEVEGWVRREGRLIWAVSLLDLDPFQDPDSPKHATSIRNHLDSLPDSALTRAFREHYQEWFGSPTQDPTRTTDRVSGGHVESTVSQKSEEGRGNTENGKPKREEMKKEERRSVGTGASDAARLSSTLHDAIGYDPVAKVFTGHPKRSTP